MKLLNKEENGFKPFELNLLVETEEEASLLWHVFNEVYLRDKICTIPSKKIAENFLYNEIKSFIAKNLRGESDKSLQ